MSIAIFDIDNCISDDSHRVGLIDRSQQGDERYRAYHEQSHLDKRCNGHVVVDHVVAGDKIVFVTGRPELYRQQTWDWLVDHFFLPEDTQLLMRPRNDHRPSRELKPHLCRKHLGDIQFAYDDLPDVVAAYVAMGIPNVKQLCARHTPVVPGLLRQAAETYEQRNALYGGSYKVYGNVMVALFPNGMELDTVDEWNRFGVLSMIVSKLTRYAAQFEEGGHSDSAHDLTVYASMLEELTK